MNPPISQGTGRGCGFPRFQTTGTHEMPRGPRTIDGIPRPPVSTVVTLRLPAGVSQVLESEALSQGVTMATVARSHLVRAVEVDPIEVAPVRRYRPSRPRPSLDVIRLAELREVVGEAVGTARQVAGLDRSRGGHRLPDLDAAIDDLLRAAATLDELKEAVQAHDLAEAR